MGAERAVTPGEQVSCMSRVGTEGGAATHSSLHGASVDMSVKGHMACCNVERRELLIN